MKTIKNLKNLIITLGVCVAISSCKKESLIQESESVEIQDDQSVEQGEPGNGEYMTGCLLLPESEYNKLPKAPEIISGQTLPSSVSLSCPTIRSQGQEGSCSAWGTAYAARSIMEKRKTGASSYSTSTNVFSPEYIFNQIKISSSCNGAYTIDALNLMKAPVWFPGNGVCTWSKMPYTDTECTTQPNTLQKADASTHRISGYSTVSKTTTAVKTQLADGKPVIICAHIDNNFKNLGGSNAVYTSYNSSDWVADHCFCIVGYDNSRNAFKVMNSWGTNWATNGFGWISYNLISSTTFIKELYVIDFVY